MKLVVVHNSPDWDAICSVWLIKRFLPNWNEAKVVFVAAGQRYKNSEFKDTDHENPIELIGEDEVIHADTGLGPLDHHQTSDQNVCAASLAFEYVKKKRMEMEEVVSEKEQDKFKAISRIIAIVVDNDHFQEVFWPDSNADYHEFGLEGVLEGLKLQKPGEDDYFVEFGMACLEALVHNFENKMWAEKEIAHNGHTFTTKWGKGIGFESINDSVIKLAQKVGYVIVVRKDPRKGYVRIKARPTKKSQISKAKNNDVDLTLVYEKLSKIDPDATWYLHVSKKMLLNGTTKNPSMKPTRLSLDDIIKALESI